MKLPIGVRPQIMIAPNALKHSAGAVAAAEAIHRGLMRSGLSADYHLFPLADGGDGTAQVLTRCMGGVMRSAVVDDPLGRPVTAHYGWVSHDRLAILEMAEASGIRWLSAEERNPMKATSFGTGQLIKAAIEAGAEEIWLGVGGSATVDGGLGALAALGVKLLDQEGRPIAMGGQGLAALQAIEWPASKFWEGVTLRVLSDVEFPLLGSEGAARMFGPQKGASGSMVEVLESGLGNVVEVVKRTVGEDMGATAKGGAAGGITATFHHLLGAKLESGAKFIIDKIGVLSELPRMHMVITAEGSLDGQSLGGKAPALLAQEAKKYGIPTVALAGRVEDREAVGELFHSVFPINPLWKDEAYALREAENHLNWAAEQLGRLVKVLGGF